MHLSLCQLLESEKDYQKHKKNIKSIEKQTGFYTDRKRTQILKQYKKKREITERNSQKARDKLLFQQNNKLITRLHNISDKQIKAPISQYKTQLLRKTGNLTTKDYSSIDRQNIRIANVIISKRCHVQTKQQLKMKFKEHLKLRQRLSHFSQINNKPKLKNVIGVEKLLPNPQSQIKQRKKQKLTQQKSD